MKLTQLQCLVLGEMLLAPTSGSELMRRCEYAGSKRAFSSALLRMLDKGLIECQGMTPIVYKPTPKGLEALLDAQPDPNKYF